jgi:hypothetical protein
MTSAFLFQPLPSALIALVAFVAMIWPGYALLHLTGHGRHRWAAALYAGPAVTFAIWILVLSGAAWASVPLKTIFGPVWIGTLVLAVVGIALRLSVSRQVAAMASETRRDRLTLWAAAALLPFVVMPATLRFGLADFVNSTYADPWSYIMVSDYLSTVARGAEGGLSALHQYASHLMNTRNASSTILAELAFGLGVKADQTMTLFCMLLLFAHTGALIGFARTLFGRTEAVLAVVVLAGLGWPANVVFAGNFDQLLLMPLLPLIATLAFRAGSGINVWSAGLLIGLLSAAALLAYVELAFIGLVIAMAFVIVPGPSLRVAIGRALLVCAIAVPVFVLASWSGLDALMTMLKGQYATTTAAGAPRPGEGYFLGLLALRRLPDTVWALGGEYAQSRWIALPWIVGALLGAVTLLGAWGERQRWSAVLALAVIAAAFLHFAWREHYSYASYKIISVNFWLVCFFTVAGGIRLAAWARPRLPQRVSVTAIVTTLLLAVAVDRTVVQANVIRFKSNALQQRAYREAQTINDMVQHAPTLLAVRDDLANEWAVFYLSDMPLLIAPYRIYMAQAHVIPFMERANRPEPAAIRYIVTDRSDAIRAPVQGARRIWEGTAYSLWEVDDPAWTVLADVVNPNGVEPGAVWLGGGKTDLLVVTGMPGEATLAAETAAGPRAEPGARLFHVTLADQAGARQIDVRPGRTELAVALAAGRNLISLTLNDPVAGTAPATGDVRPMILRLFDYGIGRRAKPAG